MSVCFISVDVETAGPTPDLNALIAIGAVAVDDLADTFYIELQPDRDAFDPEAMGVHGLSVERLKDKGVPAEQAMRDFERWVLRATAGKRPIFVAYNAPFDWMFVNVYFHRYLGRNPFGHGALDMKAVYMGRSGTPWHEINHDTLASRHGVRATLTHNALDDAKDQALLFKGILVGAKVSTAQDS